MLTHSGLLVTHAGLLVTLAGLLVFLCVVEYDTIIICNLITTHTTLISCTCNNAEMILDEFYGYTHYQLVNVIPGN